MLSSTCDEPSVATSATTIAYIPEMKFYNFETDWIFTALSDITNDILRERDESDSIGANAIVRGLTGYEDEGELYVVYIYLFTPTHFLSNNNIITPTTHSLSQTGTFL